MNSWTTGSDSHPLTRRFGRQRFWCLSWPDSPHHPDQLLISMSASFDGVIPFHYSVAWVSSCPFWLRHRRLNFMFLWWVQTVSTVVWMYRRSRFYGDVTPQTIVPPRWPSTRFNFMCLAASWCKVSQTENKMFTFYRIFGFISILRRFAYNNFKKWMCPFNRSLIGDFWGENKSHSSLVFLFCDRGSGHWPFPTRTSLQKYDLAVLNRGEHFLSPQNDENVVHFC